MQILNSFFALIFTIGCIIGGLVWMFSAHSGINILKRLGLSLLFFSAATMFLPSPGTKLIIGGLQIVAAFTLFLAAVLGLVNPRETAGMPRSAGQFIAMTLIVTIGIRLLWQEAPTWILILAGVAILAIYFAPGDRQH